MVSRQKPNPYVIHHYPCMDGFGAAYAAWRHFGDGARYIGLNYNERLPELREGADVYMLDFSLKRPLMLELAARHPRIVVIDHHISVAKDLEGISAEASNIEIVFDNAHSGAWLAWQYFHPDTEMPWLIPYIEDMDLRRHQLIATHEITKALSSYPMTFEEWDRLMDPSSADRLVAEGCAILRYHNNIVNALAETARTAYIGKYVFPAVNAPYFVASDLGHKLLDMYPNAPFAGVYRDDRDGTRSWSLRSEDHREDVQLIASILGGGGHRNASGFTEKYAHEKITFSIPYNKWSSEYVSSKYGYVG